MPHRGTHIRSFLLFGYLTIVDGRLSYSVSVPLTHSSSFFMVAS